MAYFIQIMEMRKHDISELNLTEVVNRISGTMVCDHLGARRLTGFTVELDAPTSLDDFTDFSSLTEPQVIQWIEDRLGIETINAMHESLKKECEECVAPSNNTVTIPPWLEVSGE